jgi:hypothetical protein
MAAALRGPGGGMAAALRGTDATARLREGAQLVEDLFLGGEASRVALREDPVLPDADIEDASAAADDRGVDVECLLDLSRQTGGSREIVSNAAVFNRDLHRAPCTKE